MSHQLVTISLNSQSRDTIPYRGNDLQSRNAKTTFYERQLKLGLDIAAFLRFIQALPAFQRTACSCCRKEGILSLFHLETQVINIAVESTPSRKKGSIEY